MTRKAMVTRTITSTKATALCLEVTTEAIITKEVTIAGTFADPKALNKALSKALNTDEIQYLRVKNTEEITTLYGMTEEKFIENAEILPDRAKKNETENA